VLEMEVNGDLVAQGLMGSAEVVLDEPFGQLAIE